MRSLLNLWHNKSALKSVLVFAYLSLSTSIANAATLTPRFEPQVKNSNNAINHAIFLKCDIDEKRSLQSKGVILKLPRYLEKSRHEFALVTGHGLKETRKCYVEDFKGHSRQVKSLHLAPNYKAGTNSDWAIVSFRSFAGDHIKRYDIENYFGDLSMLDNETVSFAQARGLPANTQKCRLALISLQTDIFKSEPFVSHDCKAIDGQSGSPITRIENGVHRLIGLHLGNIWTLNSPLTGKPGRLNFLRPFDEQLSQEIKQVIKNAD